MGDDFLCRKAAVDIEPFDGELVWRMPAAGGTSIELSCGPGPTAAPLPPPCKKARAKESCEGAAAAATSTTATLAIGVQRLQPVMWPLLRPHLTHPSRPPAAADAALSSVDGAEGKFRGVPTCGKTRSSSKPLSRPSAIRKVRRSPCCKNH